VIDHPLSISVLLNLTKFEQLPMQLINIVTLSNIMIVRYTSFRCIVFDNLISSHRMFRS